MAFGRQETAQAGAPTEEQVAAWRERIRIDTFANYHFEMGMALEASGDAEAALAAYHRALDIDPALLSALFCLHRLARRLGRADEERRAHAAAAAINPDFETDASFALGLAQYFQSAFTRSITELRSLLERAPAHDPARAVLALALEETGDLAAADAACPDQLPVIPGETGEDLSGALTRTATLRFNLQHYAAAARRYRLAAMCAPENDEARGSLGACANALGDLQTGARHLAVAAACRPDQAWFWVHLGLSRLSAAEPTAALRLLDYGLRINPAQGGAQQYRAQALLALGRADEAVEAMKRLTDDRPGASEFRTWQGVVLQGAGRLDAALTAYETALRLAAKEEAHPSLVRIHALCRFNLAMGLHAKGRLSEAEAACRQGLAVDDRCAWGLVNYGLLLADLGREAEAHAAFRQAAAAEPHLLRAEAMLRPWVRDRLLTLYADLKPPGFA